MTDLNYTGSGNSQDEVLKQLREHAKNNNLKLDESSIEYKVKLTAGETEYEGNANTDYGKAFAGTLQTAGLKLEDADRADLEVVATAKYQKASKPKPSGSIREASSEDLTDLF